MTCASPQSRTQAISYPSTDSPIAKFAGMCARIDGISLIRTETSSGLIVIGSILIVGRCVMSMLYDVGMSTCRWLSKVRPTPTSPERSASTSTLLLTLSALLVSRRAHSAGRVAGRAAGAAATMGASDGAKNDAFVACTATLAPVGSPVNDERTGRRRIVGGMEELNPALKAVSDAV